MAQEFWYPVSTALDSTPSGRDDAVLEAGSNKNAACRPGGGRSGPMTHDDGTSMIRFTDGALEQALNVDWPTPIGTWGGVLTAGFRSSAEFVASARHFKFCDAAGTMGSSGLASGSSINLWETTGPSDVSNGASYRPGGGAWSAADFQNSVTIFACPYMDAISGSWEHHTSVWGEISFLPPAGGFAFLLNLAGLGALPFVGAMDFQQFLRYLSWRRAHHPRHTLMRDRAEILRAWDEVKSYRHPRFFYGFAQ